MGRATVEDPLKVFRFRVEIDGFARAGFSEVTGLTRTTEISEYREGGANETVQKSGGLTNFGNITLKRGQIIGGARGGDFDFLNWASEVHDVASGGFGSVDYRRDLDVSQFDQGDAEVVRWRVENAWPTNFKAFSDLSGTSSDNSIEELELAHEGFSEVKASTTQ